MSTAITIAILISLLGQSLLSTIFLFLLAKAIQRYKIIGRVSFVFFLVHWPFAWYGGLLVGGYSTIFVEYFIPLYRQITFPMLVEKYFILSAFTSFIIWIIWQGKQKA